MKDNKVKWLLLAPALVVLITTTIYPVLESFWISLHDWNLGRSLELGPFVGLQNYLEALKDPEFWDVLKATGIFTFASVALILILGIIVGLLLSNDKPFISYIRTILIIPFALSPALIGFSWQFMLDPEYGMLHKVLGFLFPPLANVVWLGSPFYAMVALVSVEVWIWLPFVSLMFISGIMSLPKEVYEAAKVDGAGSIQSFFKITLPMLKPIIFIAAILMTMFALKVFDPVVTLTNGGPGNATRLLNYSVYQTAFRFFDMGYAAALGYILAFVLIIMQVVYMRFLVKGGGWK